MRGLKETFVSVHQVVKLEVICTLVLKDGAWPEDSTLQFDK